MRPRFGTAVFALLFCIACGAGPELLVKPAPAVPEGRYDLILFGGRYSEDLKSAAILVPSGGAYKIVPFAPRFDYRVIMDVNRDQALIISARFLKSINPNYSGFKVNQIIGPGGAPIGYEVRPLYQTFVYGVNDVLETYYRVWAEGVVRAWIELAPALERLQQQGGGRVFGHER